MCSPLWFRYIKFSLKQWSLWDPLNLVLIEVYWVKLNFNIVVLKPSETSDNAECFVSRALFAGRGNTQTACWWKMAMSQSLRAPLIIVLLCYKQRPINTSLENFSKVVILSYFTNNDFAESRAQQRRVQPKRRHRLLKVKTNSKATERRWEKGHRAP